jgi:hypothetical protein
VLKFEVRRRRGWYRAECKQLGIGISARDLNSIKETATRAARVAQVPDARVVLVPTEDDRGLLHRVASLLGWRPSREGSA